jgi:hypothetical protein
METKNYLLTDFNTERWKGINLNSVDNAIKKLSEHEFIYGEIGENQEYPTINSLCNATHTIKNIVLKEDKIFGDVTFLDTDSGRKVYKLINEYPDLFNFGIRSIGTTNDNEIIINEIFTWDIINNK